MRSRRRRFIPVRKRRGLLQDYFVPGLHNAYRPHFLRLRAVVILAALIVMLFLVAMAIEKLVVRSSTPSVAAVVSAVLIDLANADRSAEKIPRLAMSPVLQKAAQMKANDMAEHDYFAHTSPEGITPWYWFKEAHYDFGYAGENLAVYFSDSSEVEKAWMDSPLHRANILNSHFTEIGIALAEGEYQGVPTTFVVQMFGEPTSANASAGKPATIVASEQPTSTSRVAGASAEAVSVITQNPTFIAVKKEVDPKLPADMSRESKPVGAIVTPKDSVVKLFWRYLTSPKTTLQDIYSAIATLITVALTLLIFIEIRRQYPLHILYGFGLLALMAFLLYGGTAFISGHLLIA